MDGKKTIMKHSMTYGAILGVILVIISVSLYLMGINNPKDSTLAGLITYASIIGLIIYSAIQFKKQIGNGFMSFGQAFKVGFSTVFFGALVLAFYTYIFYGFIDPDAILIILEEAESSMLSQNPNMTDAEIEQALMFTEKMMSPGMMAVMTILSQAVLGAILSLISAAFLRKDNPTLS